MDYVNANMDYDDVVSLSNIPVTILEYWNNSFDYPSQNG